MKFRRLKLSGFKSFVEPTEIEIEKGLTGVVGPNGCGKSNLLEALRWVMGESSHKNMRGSGMDDVIFSGTSSRPARNVAEVVVTIDNAGREAPAAFNDFDLIEIARRIDRERGSSYRINGREARARDVQLLFADASTGARSPALVKQGQIGEIINAKPQSRRRILEEAAGITGLYSRRHDAELKLKAAEGNLTRLDDVVGQLAQQLNILRRQARQAVKYRELSAKIRRFEAIQLYAGWSEAMAAADREATALDDVVRQLAEATRAVSETSRRYEAAEGVLPELRDAATVRAAVLQRLESERASLEREESQAQARQREVEQRLVEAEHDREREAELMRDAAQTLVTLDNEERELMAALARDAESQGSFAASLEATRDALAGSQEAADQAAAALASHHAARNELTRRSDGLRDRVRRLDSELADITRRLDMLSQGDNGPETAARLAGVLDQALSRAAEAEQQASHADCHARDTRTAESESRAAYEEARRNADRLATEMRTLTKILSVGEGSAARPLLDAMTVAQGYEAALAAGLGDEIEAPADETAPVHWRALGSVIATPLPDGAAPLSRHVRAPPALDRRLSHIGIVPRELGSAMQRRLMPGQRLVSLEGDLWRWDGFSAAADAPTAAARRLAEKNRLGALSEAASVAQRAAEECRTRFEAARGTAQSAERDERQRRDEWRHATTAVDAARRAVAHQEKSASERLSRASALDEAKRRVSAELLEIRAQHERAEAERTALADTSAQETALAALRETVTRDRVAHLEARARHDGLIAETRQRRTRVDSIAVDRNLWQQRSAKATTQIQALDARLIEFRTEIAALKDIPQKLAERRSKLFTIISEAERDRTLASDRLVAAENGLRLIETERRASQEQLSTAREEQARLKARLEAAQEKRQAFALRIEEGPGHAPGDLPRLMEFDPANLPPTPVLEAGLHDLRDQREKLGGVNLVAEDEAEGVSTQLDSLVREREDVVQAIHRLRQGIASLNREGRERLTGAFGAVNAHFGDLFTTLFGGGKAELQLIESEDPLEAGLEILAHPPGKRPQVLSLLSGGEQALTALALIFAVFLTNPSPICVLDEVDAPLDDHNVERFCSLLNAMLERADTRFLIITHHPLTMARMHRLFGVTMMERGVSQLVSVDLETAGGLREAS